MKMFFSLCSMVIDMLCFTSWNFVMYASILLIVVIFLHHLQVAFIQRIHKEYIRYWKREIPCLMCEMQKYLPPTFFNAQEDYLIHQVEDIELCGPVNSRLMWMVERNFKSLKDFVRKTARTKDSMVQRYMLYQSMVYISQYLPNLAKNINLPHIWHVNSINKYEGEVMLGKGKTNKMKVN